MSLAALEAIHAVRLRRLQKAVQALEAALAEGRAVSESLLQVSGLLERGIDPGRIRSSYRDLPRLLEVAREIEAGQLGQPGPDPRPAPGRLKV